MYAGYVATWGFLTSYLLVLIATPIFLHRIKALSPVRLIVSVAAIGGLGFVFVANFIPVPEWPFNILPLIFLAILAVGLAWYAYLRVKRPEVAARIGAIQTLSDEEQHRLAELGILEVVEEERAAAGGDVDDDPDPVGTSGKVSV